MNTQKTILASMMALMFTSASVYAAEEPKDKDKEKEKEKIEKIEVTGYKSGILSAQQEKMLADNIIDVITSEGLGQYSDETLAESMQRIPGVQIERDEDGAGHFVSVRGLGPAFNKTTLNGRAIFGGGNQGGTSSGTRNAFSFSSFPPELSSGGSIVKSPTADMSAGGIGGNIDITTHRPLDMKNRGEEIEGFFGTGSIDGVYGEVSEKVSPRASALGVFNFSESFGILASVATSEKHQMTQNTRNYGGAHYTGNKLYTKDDGTVAQCRNAGCNSVVSKGGSFITEQPFLRPQTTLANDAVSGVRENTAYQLTAQWQPNDDLEIIVDWMKTEQEQDLLREELRWVLPGSGTNVTDIEYALTPQFPATVDDPNTEIDETHAGLGGYLVSANGKGTPGTSSTLSEESRDDQFYGLHLTYNPSGGPLTIDFDVSHLESDFDLTARVSPGAFIDGIQNIRFDGSGDAIKIDFVGVDGAAPYNPAQGNIRTHLNSGWNIRNFGSESDAVQLDLDYDVDFGSQAFNVFKLETGIKYQSKSQDQIKDQFRLNCQQQRGMFNELGYDTSGWTGNGGSPKCSAGRDVFFAANDFPTDADMTTTATVSPNSYLNGDKSFDTWAVPDGQAYYDFMLPLMQETGNVPLGLTSRTPQRMSEYFKGEEEITSIYLMASFDGEIGDIAFRGNLGVRYEETDVEGFGEINRQQYTPDGELVLDENDQPVMVEPFVGGLKGNYSDVLPSGNITFELTDELLWRFSASKVIARPDPQSFSGPANVRRNTVSDGESEMFGEESTSITLKDPNLQPFRADQWESILEWYPGEQGASFNLGYFNKEIENFIVNSSSTPASYQFEDITFTAQDDDPSTPDVSEAKIIRVNSVVNSDEGATITGVEFSTHLPFDWWLTPNLSANGFSKVLGNMGLRFNYTKLLDNDSAEVDKLTGDKLPLPGASPENYSASIYYSGNKFTTRVSYTYRDRQLVNPNWIGHALWAEEFGALSANMNYHMTKNLSMRLSMNNILDEKINKTVAEGLFPLSSIDNGRFVTFGIRYRM
ncbi:TonB-dependent receptor [Colwelliaceae bacterium BS250]